MPTVWGFGWTFLGSWSSATTLTNTWAHFEQVVASGLGVRTAEIHHFNNVGTIHRFRNVAADHSSMGEAEGFIQLTNAAGGLIVRLSVLNVPIRVDNVDKISIFVFFPVSGFADAANHQFFTWRWSAGLAYEVLPP